MKVAVIDNTCNTGYVLMRFLNDMGYDTDLVFLGGVEPHSDPENDTFTRQYFDKIIYTGWEKKGMLWLTRREIHAVLDKYDFIIGSDYAPAVCYRIGRRLDIFLPHGTDIFEYPFPQVDYLRFRKKDIGALIAAWWQRRGINRNTGYLLFDLTNDGNEDYVRRFRQPHFQRVYQMPPHIYYPPYHTQSVPAAALDSPYVRTLIRLREEGHTILFHHCQQIWKNYPHFLFNKGNDLLIRGLKEFTDRHPGSPVKLVMFERGADVALSKALVQELGLEDYVVWFPSMPRKDILLCLAYADLGVGELTNSWYSYNVVSEFMAMGVPIIHNCDVAYYRHVHASHYPMHYAAGPADISRLLTEYFADPEPFRASGRAAHEWWKANVAETGLDFIIRHLGKATPALRMEPWPVLSYLALGYGLNKLAGGLYSLSEFL